MLAIDWGHVVAWAVFLAFVLSLLAVDLFVRHRNPHEIRFREALLGTLLPMVAATGFAIALYYAYQYQWLDLGHLPAHLTPKEFDYYPDTGAEAVLLFVTGYVVELSLSADNVFLFVVLMGFFAVPRHLQHRVLFWGVLGALVMRAVMILAGTALLAQFGSIIYIFGAFLLYTGLRMLFSKEDTETDPSQSLPVRVARRILPLHPGYHGQRFFAKVDGKRAATTLFLVLVAIEFTDLVFALDSIPAIFGITKDPFIVFTSNVFAILGLRSMYFLLAGVIGKFHLLKYGLSLVLAFVGVKMLLPGLGELYGQVLGGTHAWHINKYAALAVVVGLLTVSVVASLLMPPSQKKARPSH